LTRIFHAAGLPEGVISCITGAGRETGNYLSGHKNIHMIAFTGSTGVGESIANKAGMIPLLFECGGNNPAIILKDANVELTAIELVKGAYSYAGQRCTAIKYVLAKQEVIDMLVPLVKKKMDEIIRMGDPRLDDTSLVGPLINEQSAIETEKVVHEAVSEGAELVTGGSRKGWFMEPSLLKNVTAHMRVVKEEIFGPVLSFIAVSDTEEAIRIVNESIYGLQASIFTGNEEFGRSIAEKLDVGTVQINGSPQRGPDHFPFMGVKASGVGTQGVIYSLEAMSRLKSIVLNPTSFLS
jgi:glyceraldehyde-3-phosphate dehydrogenase (NADP+)